ncbi:MAG: rod shape-determining protein RodA [Candidatus Hydrogenedentes bacterium]|nr:rod shape-determining protein RodA [Candidatus Hydrogenedentota bacterium]
MAISARDMTVQNASVRIINPRNVLSIDFLMPVFVMMLVSIGWVTMYSAEPSDTYAHFYKQIMFFFAGAAIAAAIISMDYRVLVSLAPAMFVVAVGMLVAVLFFASVVNGSERWLVLGPIRIQPSEVTKVVMVYVLAWYLTKLGMRIRRFHWFAATFLIMAVPMLLILKQPNLGTAACLGPLTLVMLFVAGCRLWHLSLVILAGLCVVPFAWYQLHGFDPVEDKPKSATYYEAHPEEMPPPKPFYELYYHQKMRIYTFLNPEADPKGGAWQTIQSKVAVGSGGLSGKGYLKGTQTRLNYLPEYHTDFIFSHLAEERGFLGGAIVIGLFAAFLLRGLMFARDCPDMMGTLLAAGIVTILCFHVFVNIAITVGLMPVTGIPLPFLSYGGSFYMTTMACVGILLSVPMRRRILVR